MGALDVMLTAAALVVGFLLVIGKGSFFMKGGNDQARKAMYDEKKMEKGSGVALILIGLATGIDMFTTGMAFKIGYIVVLLIIIVGLMYYLRVKCRKTEKEKIE